LNSTRCISYHALHHHLVMRSVVPRVPIKRELQLICGDGHGQPLTSHDLITPLPAARLGVVSSFRCGESS
jgi:hypothetical protein